MNTFFDTCKIIFHMKYLLLIKFDKLKQKIYIFIMVDSKLKGAFSIHNNKMGKDKILIEIFWTIILNKNKKGLT